MVQSKAVGLPEGVPPEGYVIRQLSKLERVKDSPKALCDIFKQDISKNIEFACNVVRYLGATLAERMLLLLEQLPSEYLSFVLSASDASQNTMGHHIVMSEGYLQLEPVFLRCFEKLSAEAQQRLSGQQNCSGQTMSDLRSLRTEKGLENQQGVTVLPRLAVPVFSETSESPPQYKLRDRTHMRSAVKSQQQQLLGNSMFSGPSENTEDMVSRRRNVMLTKLLPLATHKTLERTDTDEDVVLRLGNI